MAEATPGTISSGEKHGIAEATPAIVNSGGKQWNGGGDSRWAMAYGMGNSLGTPSSRESRGMAEATPGTTNSGGNHGMA